MVVLGRYMNPSTSGEQSSKTPAIWVVIAAYNEESMIGSVVEGVKPYTPHVVVVDDCSRDGTFGAARESGAQVLRHPINRGQGAALRTGIDYALLQGADVIVTFDADGQMVAAEIPAMVAPICAGTAEIVLGSRFLGKADNLSQVRRLTLRGGILFTRLFSGINLTDTHNGFRALSRKAASLMKIKEDRMAHASEILHEVARLKLAYCEVPVTVRYTAYSMARGQSSLNALRIAGRMIFSMLHHK